MEIIKELTISDNETDHTKTSCHVCGSKETYTRSNGTSDWHKYKTDENGNININGTKWDGKSYICKKCYSKEYKKPPCTSNKKWNEKQKLNRKFRNKQLSKYSNSGKGYIGEQIWCKVRGVKNCNIELDNFNSKYDHSPDPEYGLVNSKTSTIDGNQWDFSTHGEYDNAILFCMNKEWTIIERTYIITKIEMKKRKVVKISVNSSKDSWYEKYRVNETPYNEAYHSMNLKDCPILKEE